MLTTWEPDGMDGKIVPVPAHDPEASFFEDGRPWFLVTTDVMLKHYDQAEAKPWSEDTVLVMCIDAVREAPWITSWRASARRVFFVWRKRVTELDLQEGPIAGSARFLLRDAAVLPHSGMKA